MTDDELIEAVAKVMAENNVKERQDWSKLTKEQKGWWLSDAKYALAVARPIIEAPLRAENEKLRAALNRLHDAASDISEDEGMNWREKDWWRYELRAAAAALKETE